MMTFRTLLIRSALAAIALAVGIPLASAQEEPVKWSAATKATTVKPGATFDVLVTATIAEGWHLYSIAQPPPPIATRISVAKGQAFVSGGQVEGPAPQTAFDQSFGIDTEFYAESASFTLPVKAEPAAAAGKAMVKVQAYFQCCNDSMCLPPKTVTMEVPIEVAGEPVKGPAGASSGASAVAPGAPTPTATTAAPSAAPVGQPVAQPAGPPAAAPPGASAEGAVAAPQAVAPAAVPAGTAAVLPASSAAGGQPGGIDRQGSLWGFVWLAMTMGALSLLTPCVFPMVPITVSFFTKQAAGGRGKAVGQAATYVLGIVVTFTVLGMAMALLVGATSLNRFGASPWLNLFISGIFIAFALSLFGVFDFGLPPALVNKLDSLTRKKGGNQTLATLLMGLTFTLTTFSCTAPFIGTLLVMAAGGDWQWPLVGMVAYSTVFAAPFFVLALMPQLVASLPKSGGWMNAVKVLMGFLVIAAAMKFVANVDKVWGWGIFTHDVVLAAWVVIFVLMAIYVLGLFRFAHEAPVKHVGIGRLTTSIVCGTIGLWLMTGLHGKPLGELEAFLPPPSLKAGAATSGASDELPWITNDYEQALAVAQREKKLIFVDYTGYTCTNCRWMEANMLPRPEVREQLAKFVLVRLYTDGEGEPFQKQQRLQQTKYKTVALPYYAIENADGSPVASFPGLTRNPVQFVGFLQKGME